MKTGRGICTGFRFCYLVFSLHCQKRPFTQRPSILPSSRSISDVAAVRPMTITGVQVRQILIVGDGDFSFSRAIAEHLGNITLTSSCLDELSSLESNIPTALAIVQEVEKRGRVLFGIDCRKLMEYEVLKSERFERIIFNFPHVPGKNNIKRNRELLFDFLISAKQIMSRGGEIYVALCEGQGGTQCASLYDWKYSWQLPIQAAEAGLSILKVEPFDFSIYNLTGRRNKELTFFPGDALLYTLSETTEEDGFVNLFPPKWKHEIHFWINDESAWKALEEQGGHHFFSSWVAKFIGESLVDRVRFVESYTSPTGRRSKAYEITYCNREGALSRTRADELRGKLEEGLTKGLPADLRKGKNGFRVSDCTYEES